MRIRTTGHPERTAIKGILIFGSRMIRNLNATSPLACVLEQVNVRAFVESMVARLDLRS